jgi:hypothetical protein
MKTRYAVQTKDRWGDTKGEWRLRRHFSTLSEAVQWRTETFVADGPPPHGFQTRIVAVKHRDNPHAWSKVFG